MNRLKRNKGLELLTLLSALILLLYTLGTVIFLGLMRDILPSSIEEIRQGFGSIFEIILIALILITALLNLFFSVLFFIKAKRLRKNPKGMAPYVALLFFSALGFIIFISIPILRLASIGYALIFIMSIICLYVIHKVHPA